jgi:hypothetical protein
MPEQTEQSINPKTEVPPEVVHESPNRGVIRLAELKLFMVEYVDADQPGPRVRPVAVSPETKQVFFLDDKIVGRQTQAWFAAEILKKAK